MAHKSLAALLMLISTVLGGPAIVDYAVNLNGVTALVVVEGPTEAAVGQLVHLTVNGSRPAWLAPTGDVIVDGNDCYVSFRSPGSFDVVVSSVTNGKTSLVKHTIVVGAKQNVEKPKPEPRNLSDDVRDWCVEAGAPRDACRALGESFIRAASNSSTVEQILKLLSESNREIDQRGCELVLDRIQMHIFTEVQGKDFDTHQCAISEIGDGLLSYAKSQ